MGSIIGLPVVVISLIAEKGLIYCILYYTSYIYLLVTWYFHKKRVNDYDFLVNGPPEKIGFLAQEQEWKLEPPQEKALLRQVADDVFCFGTNSNGNYLMVHISRRSNSMVRCSLLFHLASGRKFTLPEDHLFQKESKEINTFGSSRLKVQCLQPMRKWRIFFNGILKEDSNSERQEYKHVKFTFIWTASSEVFDFKNDISKKVLSNSVATTKPWTPIQHLKKVQNMLDNYEQPGMILGTFNIEGEEEKELYLWGIRGHYMGKIRKLTKGDFFQIYGQFQTGAALHVEILTIPGIAERLIHGFVMHSNGFIDPIDEFTEEASGLDREQDFKFHCGNRKYNLIVKKCNIESHSFEKEYEGETSVTSAKMLLNHVEGIGFLFAGSIQRASYSKSLREQPVHYIGYHLGGNPPLTVHFENADCKNHELTGGKGSSLGKLYSLSKVKDADSLGIMFQVPKGIVVTTEAYKVFTKGELETYILDFEKTVWSDPTVDTNQLCERTMEKIRKCVIPGKIVESLRSNLQKVFGGEAIQRRFAVRSSATGEDTEQMSAAGQMETYLGLKGMDEILNAVKNCWASQFSFQAVEYKRRYGQLLNTPMAVVVQEMVPCETAGVLFTCDPVTGNPAFISITANWGLGETVVSASADPDMVILKRDIADNIELFSYEIGNKGKKLVMEEESGTEEVKVEAGSERLCISEAIALKLGQLALMVEKKYGAPRDIEWGTIGEKVFLFQARPITSLDVDTDFETKHIFDNYLRMEREYVTKANIGEVMPGALSPLGIDVIHKIMNSVYARQGRFRSDGYCAPDVPYFQRLCLYFNLHGFIGFVDGFFRFGTNDPSFIKAMMISVLGRTIDDSEISRISDERYSHNEPGFIFRMGVKYKFFENLFMTNYRSQKRVKEFAKIDFPSMEGLSSEKVLHEIGLKFHHCMDAMNIHINTFFCASTWNLFLLTVLAKAEDDLDTDVYRDFGYLLSTCTDVESADVPAAIQGLGKTISSFIDIKRFKSVSVEEALEYLKSFPAVNQQINNFIEKHGHRCLKEFDVQSKPWDSGPGMLKLVKMLQSYVTTNIKAITKRDVSTFSAILSHMHVQLDFISKLKLRFILPNCRRAVRGRELSKSMLIKSIHKLRKAVQKLSSCMVQEGFLPNEDLIYYLCFEEIRELIKLRSPRILTRAIRRQKVHSELDKLEFPEICIGIPKPINQEEDIIILEEGVAMKGIPVSQGAVKGTARVITDFEEVSQIQQDDILITYSTDIGWSPYFPLLSGIVTELGGLISHGAVVAREYGLPCIVGLHGATKVFKSGDTVFLDGNKGILKKIEVD